MQLLCLDASRPLNAWEENQLTMVTPVPRIIVLTKTDLARTDSNSLKQKENAVRTSSTTGQGLVQLRLTIAKHFAESAAHETTVVAGTAVRCQESLRLAADSLARAREIAQLKRGEELIAAELRLALEELGRVVGAVYTDDILDRIFSRFCIGK